MKKGYIIGLFLFFLIVIIIGYVIITDLAKIKKQDQEYTKKLIENSLSVEKKDEKGKTADTTEKDSNSNTKTTPDMNKDKTSQDNILEGKGISQKKHINKDLDTVKDKEGLITYENPKKYSPEEFPEEYEEEYDMPYPDDYQEEYEDEELLEDYDDSEYDMPYPDDEYQEELDDMHNQEEYEDKE